MMYNGLDGKEYHQIGMFFTHFHSDLQGVIEALTSSGYSVCNTLDGDMIIMKAGDYDISEYEDNDDDDENGDDNDFRIDFHSDF